MEKSVGLGLLDLVQHSLPKPSKLNPEGDKLSLFDEGKVLD